MDESDFLSFYDSEVKEVKDIPWKNKENPKPTYIRSLSYSEIKEHESLSNNVIASALFNTSAVSPENVRAYLIVRAMCKASGEQTFSDFKAGEKAIGDMRGQDEALDYIYEQICIMNNIITEEKLAELKQLESDEKSVKDLIKESLEDDIKKAAS